MRSGFVYYPITYAYVKEKHQKHRRIKQARSPSTRPKYLSFQSLPSRWQNRGVFASQELVLPFPWRLCLLVCVSLSHHGGYSVWHARKGIVQGVERSVHHV